MIGLLVISHHFKLPEVGNNEMILAVNAAIAQLSRFGVLDHLYIKYFSLIREDDQHVFDNYLNGIQKLDSGYMIMPSYTKMMMDCDVNNVRFPTPANLTIGGTLNDVLNTHILYVLQEIDSPGFWTSPYSQQVYDATDFPGFEHELLSAIVNEISAYYLSVNETIELKISQKTQKSMFRDNKKNRKYIQIQDQQALHKLKDQKSHHIGAGGYPNSNLKQYGSFSCGTIMQEIGVMVNSATLDKFYKSNGKNQEDVDIFKEKFLGASSFDDLLAVSRDYLKSGSNIPVCAKTGGLGHLATKRLFDNCGDNCLNENVFAELYTDTNYKQGVFDQFLNDKCLLFVAESAHMINLYKILTDGVEKKIFTQDKLRYQGNIKFKYLFGTEFVDTVTQYRYQEVSAESNPFMAKTFLSGFVMPSDSVNYQKGNNELSQILTYSIEQWSQKIADLYITKYGETVRTNFVTDYSQNIAVPTSDQGQTWFQSDPNVLTKSVFQQISKVYQSLVSIDSKVIPIMQDLVKKFQNDPAFASLKAYMNNQMKDAKNYYFPPESYPTENQTRNYLLYNLVVDYFTNNSVIVSKSEEDTFFALFKHNNTQFYKYLSKPFNHCKFWTQKGNQKFTTLQATVVMGTFVFNSIQLGDDGQIMSYYNDPGIEKTQEALITHLALINESNKWPEFMFLANDFISKMNTIETLTSYQEFQTLILDKGFIQFFDSIDSKLYSKNFIFKKDRKTVEMFGVLSANTNLSKQNYLVYPNKQLYVGNVTLDLSTTNCKQDCLQYFYRISSMYPYTDNTISKLYFAQNIKIENIPCIVTIKPLSEIKLDFHKYFVKNVTYDNTTEVMLCLQYPFLPLALTKTSFEKPSYNTKQNLGTFDLIKSTRSIFMGAFQKIPGFRVLPSRSGFDDVIMKNTAFIVKEAFGQSFQIQSWADLLPQENRLPQLSGQTPLLSILMSGEFAEDTTVNFARNYLQSNITFVAYRSSKCSKYVGSLELTDYQNHHCATVNGVSNLKFCLGPSASAFYNFFAGNYKQNITFQNSQQSTNVLQMFNALIAGECDIGIAYDIHVLPAIKQFNNEDFVVKQFQVMQKHVAPMIRKDSIDALSQPLIQQDTTLISLIVVSAILIFLILVVGIVLFISFRSWLRFINRIL